MQSLIFIFLLLQNYFSYSYAGEQSVTVKGIVNCRGHKQPGTFVLLYDEDSIPVFDDDDLLGSVVADYRGVFCVKGYTTEISTIEPYISIEHNCGFEGLNEKRVYTRVIPQEYITEGPKAKRVYHMGDIELLTPEAPVQKYEKRIFVESSIDERIRQCIPVYVQYKRFYEKTIIEGGIDSSVPLPVDEEDPVIEPTNVDIEETTTEYHVPIEQDEKRGSNEENIDNGEIERLRLEEERIRVEETRRIEEEQRRLDEIRRLEEEKLKLEEIRRIEEEKLRIEELRRQEEENQRLEQERREEERRLEEERRADEERRRNEELQLQEQRRKEQEEEHKKRLDEYNRREKEYQDGLKRRDDEIRRREEEERTRKEGQTSSKIDPCVHYPVLTQTHSISRSMDIRHEYVEDPCLRK